MLRRKGVKEVVDTMRLPAVVRFSWSFWGDARNGATAKELKFVMRLVCRSVFGYFYTIVFLI